MLHLTCLDLLAVYVIMSNCQSLISNFSLTCLLVLQNTSIFFCIKFLLFLNEENLLNLFFQFSLVRQEICLDFDIF